jgi:hypothetical protein
MKRIASLFFAVFSVLPELVIANEQINLARNIVVESCSEDLSDCRQISKENSSIVKIPLSLVGGYGMHGEVRFRTIEAGTPFKGEIFVNKLSSGYSIYAVLRSGRGTSRNSVTKKVVIEDPSTLKTIELVDRPIIIEGKTYRARMIVSSAPEV